MGQSAFNTAFDDVSPEIGPNCLQMLSADEAEVAASKDFACIYYLDMMLTYMIRTILNTNCQI